MLKRILFAALVMAGLSTGAQAQATNPYLGQIMIFAGNFCPYGWAPTEGQLLPLSQYTALFSVLGTTYGGNGTTNFALPKTQPFYTYGDKQTLMVCIALRGVFPSRN